MTKDDLEKLGVVSCESKVYPHKFNVIGIGEMFLFPPYTMEQLYNRIHDRGIEEGVRLGKEDKINEIKNVLNIK